MAENDPLLSILMDKEAIDIVSTLIAKLESITFDEGRTSVFRTPWARNLFAECTARLTGSPIDLDEWFRSRVKHSRKIRRDIDATLYQQPVETDWLASLLELELGNSSPSAKRGSLLRILHNVLELEDMSMSKLSKYCKTERQYNFEGIAKPASSSSSSRPLLPLAQPRVPAIGSVEDLLARKKN